jgi:2-dehydropantoate 2-reductase
MQNGLAEEEIAEVIGRPKTVGCFIQFGSDYLGPGHIQLAYDFPIRVGEIDGSITERVHTVRDVLNQFMPTFVTTNIWGFLWAKMCLGSLYFAGALTAESFGNLLADHSLRPLFAAVARETCTVARALGVRVEAFQGFDPNLFMVDSPDLLDPAYAQWDLKPRPAGVPEEKPLKVHTGIQRDIIVRKRRTEVDKQPGVVVQKGRLADVLTPLNRRIVEMIHEIEDGKRPMGRENLDELRNSAPEW